MFVTSVAKILITALSMSGSVSGVVTDGETGEALAGAVVSLPDLDRAAVTDSAGRYVFLDVPAGPQHVTVRRIGYSAPTLHALVPRQGTLEINIALRPEPIAVHPIEIQVQSSVPVRGLEAGENTAYPDRGLSMAAVRAHPLSAEPDAFRALGGGEVVLRPESPSGIHVRGGASDQVTYLLDGIPVLSPYHVAGTFSAWNPDALSRLELLSSSPPPEFPESLSGTVSASTRIPDSHFRMQGSASTNQIRATIDGPLGRAGAGYLLALRMGFPGVPHPKQESTYMRGGNRDWLAKLEWPLLGGRVRLLAFDSESEISVASIVVSESATSETALPRHTFDWHSTSVGGEWARDLGRVAVRMRAWSAVGDAEAVWSGAGDSAAERLAADRRDQGVAVVVEIAGSGSRTTAGVRAQRSRTSYQLDPVVDESAFASLTARTPTSAVFLQHTRTLTSSSEMDLAMVGTFATGDVHLSPRALFRWTPSPHLSVSGGYARLHQFAQSLRNTESMVGNIFPVDLYVGAGSAGVPVARSDQAIVALELRPIEGVRFGMQAYAREFEGLVLVAPRDGAPFASRGFVAGSGDAHGVSVEAGANGARYGIAASYGFQDLSFEHAESSYIPDHGATHSVDAGVVVYPSAKFSVRVGAAGVFGRHATLVVGPIEWEACNLLDQGCEFAGRPELRPDSLGTTALPAYVRLDFGIARHWHLELGDRDGVVSVYGTVTNILNRKNLLGIALDPATGELAQLEMRPRSPLVVGVDWRF